MSSSMDDSDEEFDQLNAGPDSELEKVRLLYKPVFLNSFRPCFIDTM